MINATLVLVDSYGRVTHKRFETTATTLAAAQGIVNSLLTIWPTISDLGVVRVNYTYQEPGGVDVSSGANIDVGATFSTTTTDGGGAAIKIPGIKAALVGANGMIDPDQDGLNDFFELFMPEGGLLYNDGEQLESVRFGMLDK